LFSQATPFSSAHPTLRAAATECGIAVQRVFELLHICDGLNIDQHRAAVAYINSRLSQQLVLPSHYDVLRFIDKVRDIDRRKGSRRRTYIPYPLYARHSNQSEELSRGVLYGQLVSDTKSYKDNDRSHLFPTSLNGLSNYNYVSVTHQSKKALAEAAIVKLTEYQSALGEFRKTESSINEYTAKLDQLCKDTSIERLSNEIERTKQDLERLQSLPKADKTSSKTKRTSHTKRKQPATARSDDEADFGSDDDADKDGDNSDNEAAAKKPKVTPKAKKNTSKSSAKKGRH
jgi:hypothetical protein